MTCSVEIFNKRYIYYCNNNDDEKLNRVINKVNDIVVTRGYINVCESGTPECLEIIVNHMKKEKIIDDGLYIKGLHHAIKSSNVKVIKWFDIRFLVAFFSNNRFVRIIMEALLRSDNEELYHYYDSLELITKNQELFNITITYKAIKIAKLIYDTDTVDLRDNNDIIFKTACRSNSLYLCTWLQSLEPRFNFVVDNGKITFKGIKYSIIESELNIDQCCPICIDKANVLTDCNHTFCSKCLNNWYKKNSSCPMCRTVITSVVKKN